MEKKNIIIGLVILALALGGIYFIQQNEQKNVAPEEGTEQQQEEEFSSLVKDDFSINIPQGWQETTAATGVLAMVVNANEESDDPVAQELGFRSYYAVSTDAAGGQEMDSYREAVKDGLEQSISGIIFTNEEQITINGREGYALEAELTQQDIDFKVLVVMISGEGDDVWVLSFNTVKVSWDKYSGLFYDIANSFVLNQ